MRVPRVKSWLHHSSSRLVRLYRAHKTRKSPKSHYIPLCRFHCRFGKFQGSRDLREIATTSNRSLRPLGIVSVCGEPCAALPGLQTAKIRPDPPRSDLVQRFVSLMTQSTVDALVAELSRSSRLIVFNNIIKSLVCNN